MAGSLQDQLLKSGLVNKKQVKKARHESRSAKKRGRDGSDAGRAASLEAERRAKAERDRELNQEIAQARKARDLEAQTKDLIARHGIARDGGEIPFRFQDGEVVRTLAVSGAMRADLITGALAVVGYGSEAEVVPAEIALRLEQRDPSCIKLWNRGASEEDTPDPEDPYRDYTVPDDLVW